MTDPVDPLLERLMHEELRALPAPRAPEGLAARVMVAASMGSDPKGSDPLDIRKGGQTPSGQTPFFSWPLPLQAGAVLALVVLIAGLWNLFSLLPQVEAPSALARIQWRLVLEPALTYVFALVTVTLLAGAGFWSLLSRVVWGGHTQ